MIKIYIVTPGGLEAGDTFEGKGGADSVPFFKDTLWSDKNSFK